MGTTLTAADFGLLPELSISVAQICVRGVRENRILSARRECLELGADFEDAVVRDVARFFSALWGIDAPIEERKSCAVCGRHRKHGEELCPCFETAGLGRYLKDVVFLSDVERYKVLEPRGWRDLVFERARCECGAVFNTTLGRIDVKLRGAAHHGNEGVEARRDSHCRPCHERNQNLKRQADQRAARREPPRQHQPVQPMRAPAPALAAVGAKLQGQVPAAPPAPIAAPASAGDAFGDLGAPPALPHNAGAHAAPELAPSRKEKGRKGGAKGKSRQGRVPLAELSAAVAAETEASPEA